MKYLLLLLPLLAYAQVENEQYSVQMGMRGKPEITIIYEFPLQHTDGARIPLQLVKYKKQCDTINGTVVCYGGNTIFTSDNTRKQDPEHPVDTSEISQIDFRMKGKTPVLKTDEVIHELHHAVQYHWMSRPICEYNWREGPCLERMAYDMQSLYNQLIQLQKQKKIILI